MFKPPVLLWLAVSCAQVPAQAAEIVLERSAVDKLVTQALFKDHGRLTLAGGACGSFLDRPSVSLGQGRIQIRTHLKAQVGVPVGDDCAGLSLSSWARVSGRPSSAAGSLRLEDIRIDEVDDPDTRAVLVNSGLASAFPRAVELDVRGAVQNMLARGDNPIQTTVDAFSFQDVSVVGDSLRMQFDFKLTGH